MLFLILRTIIMFPWDLWITELFLCIAFVYANNSNTNIELSSLNNFWNQSKHGLYKECHWLDTWFNIWSLLKYAAAFHCSTTEAVFSLLCQKIMMTLFSKTHYLKAYRWKLIYFILYCPRKFLKKWEKLC